MLNRVNIMLDSCAPPSSQFMKLSSSEPLVFPQGLSPAFLEGDYTQYLFLLDNRCSKTIKIKTKAYKEH